MKFALMVTTKPTDPKTVTAINIANAIVAQKHELLGVFFYQEGVLNASEYLCIPNDEYQTTNAWSAFTESSAVPLHLCSTAAEKHGLIEETEQEDFEHISPAFQVSGLGQLVELTSKADKVIKL
ncbi:sulfurtransferase complex subunit TusD [Thalassotalea fusca]